MPTFRPPIFFRVWRKPRYISGSSGVENTLHRREINHSRYLLPEDLCRYVVIFSMLTTQWGMELAVFSDDIPHECGRGICLDCRRLMVELRYAIPSLKGIVINELILLLGYIYKSRVNVNHRGYFRVDSSRLKKC